eukprot:gene14260-biopygen15652
MRPKRRREERSRCEQLGCSYCGPHLPGSRRRRWSTTTTTASQTSTRCCALRKRTSAAMSASTPTTSTRSATTTARGRRPPRCSSSCASDVQWGGKRCAIRWGRGEGTGGKRLVSYTKYHSGAEGAGKMVVAPHNLEKSRLPQPWHGEKTSCLL